MTSATWSLRPANADDRDFLFELHRLTMRPYVEAIWGWDDDEQARIFDETFTPDDRQIIQIDAEDAGVLAVTESEQEIWLELIEIDPRRQGAGVGTAVVRSLLRRAADTDRRVALRVLRTNVAARSLYERLGFVAFRETDVRVYLRADPRA
jgi:GNAT superfamily N-acetyltransferase